MQKTKVNRNSKASKLIQHSTIGLKEDLPTSYPFIYVTEFGLDMIKFSA